MFGYIVGGRSQLETQTVSVNLATLSEVNETLQGFWETEEIQKKLPFTKEEEACEAHFKSTHTRETRMVVSKLNCLCELIIWCMEIH